MDIPFLPIHHPKSHTLDLLIGAIFVTADANISGPVNTST